MMITDEFLNKYENKIKKWNKLLNKGLLQDYLKLSDEDYLELMYELEKRNHSSIIGTYNNHKNSNDYSNIAYVAEHRSFRKVIQL